MCQVGVLRNDIVGAGFHARPQEAERLPCKECVVGVKILRCTQNDRLTACLSCFRRGGARSVTER